MSSGKSMSVGAANGNANSEIRVTTGELQRGDITVYGAVESMRKARINGWVTFVGSAKEHPFELDVVWNVRRTITGRSITRVSVNLMIERYSVKGTAEQPYVITTVNTVPVACTCPDFIYRGHDANHVCKHMTEVFRLSDQA